MKNNYLGLSVEKLNLDTHKTNCLYDSIANFKEADLLAQLAMQTKANNEIIIIMPGSNRGIKEHPEEYQKALRLAEKYDYIKHEKERKLWRIGRLY